MQPYVLVAEDEDSLVELLTYNLRAENSVSTASLMARKC